MQKFTANVSVSFCADTYEEAQAALLAAMKVLPEHDIHRVDLNRWSITPMAPSVPA